MRPQRRSRILLYGLVHVLSPVRCHCIAELSYKMTGLDVAPTADIVSGARFGENMLVQVGDDTSGGHGHHVSICRRLGYTGVA